MPAISVIICTHNPRPDYLRRVLDALKAQTLQSEQWELLLINNASNEPLASTWDLSWHLHARHIREDELGLTPARLRGIEESTGELLVFVDDDNVLDPDFLACAVLIAKDYPFVGIWGGQVRAEFETLPPDWIAPHLRRLAVHEFADDRWSNIPGLLDTEPCGAGMCIRAAIAREYARQVCKSGRTELGRKGTSLVSGEDTDMVWTCVKQGWGAGLFNRLKLLHLLPTGRLSEQYLLRLAEGIAFSGALLRHHHGLQKPQPKKTIAGNVKNMLRMLFITRRQRRFEMASHRGLKRALMVIKGGI